MFLYHVIMFMQGIICHSRDRTKYIYVFVNNSNLTVKRYQIVLIGFNLNYFFKKSQLNIFNQREVNNFFANDSN